MKRIFIYFSIWFALIYFINGYVSYFQFSYILPDDLFRYPYKELTRAEVAMWKFVLQWAIPSLLSALFIYFSKFNQRVVFNWGIVLVGAVTLVTLCRFPLFYLAAQVPGGGALFVLKGLWSYSALPTSIALLLGTSKIFLSLKPVATDTK